MPGTSKSFNFISIGRLAEVGGFGEDSARFKLVAKLPYLFSFLVFYKSSAIFLERVVCFLPKKVLNLFSSLFLMATILDNRALSLANSD